MTLMHKGLITAVLGLLIASPALASSVLQVSFEDLVRSSELVFEGRVVNKRAAVDKGGAIKTYVTFEVLDVVKGAHSSRTVEIPFLGGTVNGLTMEVSDMQQPEIGEHGVYFVESLSNPPVHPLVGWDQGHFLVRTDSADRADHVFSHGGKPIAGFESRAAKSAGLSKGVAAGLMLGEASRGDRGLTATQFKQKIKDVLGSR